MESISPPRTVTVWSRSGSPWSSAWYRTLRASPDSSTGSSLTTAQTIECEAAFIAPQPRPNDQILEALGCQRDNTTGLVIVDGFGQTSVPGVWAAGNVVTPTAQVITAAGAGNASAIAIDGCLLQKDLDAATAARP